jgi:hypothetical protein
MTDIDKMAAELKQKRDELALQVKLGSMEAKQDFDELEKVFNDFAAKAELKETTAGVSEALSALGEELKRGYERLTKAL